MSAKNKPVEVTWGDAWQSSEYWTYEELDKVSAKILKSYGFCLRDDKGGVAIAMDRLNPTGDDAGDDRFRDVKFIPRSWVRKVKVLR